MRPSRSVPAVTRAAAENDGPYWVPLPPPASGRRRVGVLFVHGIGSQSQSSTVREFGEPLLDWLKAWHRNECPAGRSCDDDSRVGWSHLSYGDPWQRGPARFTIDLPAHRGTPPETWVVAEGWWAARLEAPPFKTMISWSSAVFARVLARLAQRARQEVRRYDPASGTLRVDAVGGALLLLQSGLFIVCYGLAALVGYPLLWLLFVLAQIPIKQVEEFVLTKLMRPFLTEHVGDFEVFINDEIQALNIRRAILDAIDWLARIERCSHIIVAGHSQGAAVAYDALLSGEARAIERVRLLVTFGAAINNVWDLAPRTFHRLDGDLPRHIPWCDFWATYDPVAHGRIDLRPSDPLAQPPQEFAVANSFSVVSDHGGYLANPEEFVGRLAQLIERPADRTRSRFWKPLADETPWVQRRRDRLLTLVAWRLWTIAVFGFAITARSDRLLADGAAVWSWILSLPGVAAIAGGVTVLTTDLRQALLPPYGPATFFGASFLLATAALVAAAREQQRATAVLPTIAASVVLLTFVLFPILFSLVLGVLAWCLIGLAAYLFFARVAFDDWHRRSGDASARSGRPTTRQRGQIAWRSAMVGLLTLAIAIAVPIVGALPPVPR